MTYPIRTTARRLAFVTLLSLALSLIGSATSAGVPKASNDENAEIAILAGGCFWGMEQLLRELDGVLDTEVGYTADRSDRRSIPAESVHIVFDPATISYEEILRYYFRIHDPTTMNRQGNDRGAEYRSAIFVLSDEQRRIAERVRAAVDASGFWKKPLVTEISDAGTFKVAPEYHQDYLVKNPGGYTCHYERK
jgi:methionine-S-sulfoxide reductase